MEAILQSRVSALIAMILISAVVALGQSAETGNQRLYSERFPCNCCRSRQKRSVRTQRPAGRGPGRSRPPVGSLSAQADG